MLRRLILLDQIGPIEIKSKLNLEKQNWIFTNSNVLLLGEIS